MPAAATVRAVAAVLALRRTFDICIRDPFIGVESEQARFPGQRRPIGMWENETRSRIDGQRRSERLVRWSARRWASTMQLWGSFAETCLWRPTMHHPVHQRAAGRSSGLIFACRTEEQRWRNGDSARTPCDPPRAGPDAGTARGALRRQCQRHQRHRAGCPRPAATFNRRCLGRRAATRRRGSSGARARAGRHARSESPAASVQPHRIKDFVGREPEFTAIRSFLAAASTSGIPRTVVIAGPPGVGKTALAIESAQRLRDPGSVPLFLDLLGPNPSLARPPLSVVQALLRQVSGPGDADPPGSLDAAVARWHEHCVARQRTIVLDNAAEEAQVRPVLAGGNVRVIITSRRSLAGLQAVERIHLDPLPSRDSIELLREIVPARRGPMTTSSNSPDCAATCPLLYVSPATASPVDRPTPPRSSCTGSAQMICVFTHSSRATCPPKRRSDCRTTISTASRHGCSAICALSTGSCSTRNWSPC